MMDFQHGKTTTEGSNEDGAKIACSSAVAQTWLSFGQGLTIIVFLDNRDNKTLLRRLVRRLIRLGFALFAARE